jgi:aminoglycoside/choline kinase family phosphotransferase
MVSGARPDVDNTVGSGRGGIIATRSRGGHFPITEIQALMDSLLRWCSEHVAPEAGSELGLEMVSGDASFRRYYRLVGCSLSRIAVHAPPDKERNLEFTRIAELLRAAGVHAPEVLAFEPNQGFLLLEDLGDRLLRPALDEASVEQLYGAALETLLAIQQAPTAGAGWELADYGRPLLEQEMRLFPEWFLRGLLGIPPTAAETALIDGLFSLLATEALAQPQVLVHRDYHSRNLMLLDAGELGVIDFQDAVRGPVTYDLVSLLRDCYVSWPPERVEAWALGYAARAVDAGIMAPIPADRFLRCFDLMGLQRHIKVLGIFARLWLRDGKAGYLRDLPLVIHYTLSVAQRHPDTRDFADWFRERVLPLASRQDWFSAA